MSSQDKTAVQPVGGKTADKVFRGVAYACGILILVVLAAVFLFLFFRAWPLIGGDQAANSQTVSSFTGGKASSFWGYVLPLLFGTVLVSLLALLIAFFVSIGIALFISHYAPKKLATALSYVVDLLAAIPSVIYGLWGGLILVPAIYPFWNWVASHLGFIPLFEGPAANPPRTVATVAVVLAVMILPIITSMSRDIFMQTPRLHEEAALALGATKWEMIRLAVLPFGKSGIVSASMLALGRALGETMAVLMILSPGLNYSIKLLQASQNQTIAANIAAQYPEANELGVSTLIGTGLILFLITFCGQLHCPQDHRESDCVMTAAENTEKTPMDGAPKIDFDRFRPTRSSVQRRKSMDIFMWVLIALAFIIACVPLVSPVVDHYRQRHQASEPQLPDLQHDRCGWW